MVEQQKQSNVYVAGGTSFTGRVSQYSTSRPSLRVCQDCSYSTFSHYVKCPRCNSEKWANST